MGCVIEIRSYNLKPGTRAEFHRRVTEQAIPMLDRWQMDVVGYGASLDEENAYYLIRSFADVDDLRKSEDAFYGSDEWKQGPRAGILELIENYASTVLEVDDATLAGMREAKGKQMG